VKLPLRRLARVLLVGLLVAALPPLSGCSYRLVGSSEGRDVSVSVVTLGNDSVEPGVELTVTRALRREFLRRAAPRLVSDPGGADWVIRGRVLPLTTRANSFDTVSLALEYQVAVELSLDVEDGEGSALAIDPTALRETELYLASADAEATRKNRKEALRRIADILAGRIHDAIGLQLADRKAAERAGKSQEPATEADPS
jgi:hypothetical protein